MPFDWVAAAIAGGTLISGILGNKSAKKGAETAADATTAATQMQIEHLEKMNEQARADFAPFLQVGYDALPQLTGFSFEDMGLPDLPAPLELPSANALLDLQIPQLPAGLNLPDIPDLPQFQAPGFTAPTLEMPETPDLSKFDLPETPNILADPNALPAFDFQFDPQNALYLWQKKQGEEAINKAAAARGNYNSRAAINALSDFNQSLAAHEVGRQFDRAVTTHGIDFNRAQQIIGNAVAKYGLDLDQVKTLVDRTVKQYGLDANRAQTLYAAAYQGATDEYRATYQGATAEHASEIQNALTKYGLSADEAKAMYGAGVDQYGRKIGQYGLEKANILDTTKIESANALTKYNTAYQKAMDLWKAGNMPTEMNYNALLNLAKIGQGAAGTTTTTGANTAANIANALGNLGNALSNIYSNLGNQDAAFWAGLPGAATNALGSYYFGKKAGLRGQQNNNALTQYASFNPSTVTTPNYGAAY